jgi:pimeloyl-ACP methyl ester carboxylesterase
MRYLLFCLIAWSASATAAEPAGTDDFTVKGVKIHYLTAGQGEPVVLIHGLYASAQLNWGLPGIIDALAKDHRVIALDLPGHGASDKPNDEAAYGAQLVEDVALLLDHLKIEKAHIAGYSLGGMVTAKFLVQHPQRAISGTLGGMGWLQQGSGLQHVWTRMGNRQGPGTPPEFLKAVGQLAITEQELRDIKVPVKVLIGENDPVKRLYVEPLRKARPDWPVVEITDAGHLSCVAKEQFRTELVSWIRDQTK